MLYTVAFKISDAPIKLMINVVSVKVKFKNACFPFLYSKLNKGIPFSNNKKNESPEIKKIVRVDEGIVSKY